MDRKEFEALAATVANPDYIKWNKERIFTSVEALRRLLNLKGLKTLDLGHDTFVGLLLAWAGAELVGNVAPDDDSTIKPDQPRFELPGGQVYEWTTDAFDFEARFPYHPGTFDLVTAFEVVEHVVGSPRQFIREIKRVLKPGGYLFFGTPNVNAWAKMMRQFQQAPLYDSKPYSQDFGPRHFMCHVYEYSPWELKMLLKSEGFEIVNFRTWDPYPSDPRGLRNGMLRVLFAASLFSCGYVKEALLLFRERGHQIGLLARSV